MKQKIVFVTGNKMKLEEAKKILGNKYDVINESIDLTEIQSVNNKEVIKYKINEAYEIASKIYGDDVMVMVEDTGLIFKNMGSFPGALIKFYKDNVGLKGIVKFNGGSKAVAITMIAIKSKNKTYLFSLHFMRSLIP